MPDEPVRLRPIEEADLDLLSRFDTDAAASQPFEWTGFRDPGARRRRWEVDGWIGRDSAHLAGSLADGTGRAREPAHHQGWRPRWRLPGDRRPIVPGASRPRVRGLAFIGGRWRDGVLYARPREDPA
jgi:RimJ/RimL family protein N-acetyltransferase